MTTIDWPSKSGTVYRTHLYVPSATFFEVPGVYILCRRIAKGRFEAIYVGEAESLYERLNTARGGHDGYKRAVAHGFDHICAMVVNGGKAERLRIETDLRHALDPVCNRQDVPVR